MKKAILIGMVLVLVLFLIPSCAAGVPQEEHDKLVSDLAAVQTQIQSLQDDLTATQTQIQSLQDDLAEVQPQIQPPQVDEEAAEEKRAEALVYAEYMDIALSSLWEEAGLTPRFAFESDTEWMTELKGRADDIGDAELSNYFEELEQRGEWAMLRLCHYCLDRVEKALK